MDYIEPELREGGFEIDLAKQKILPRLIELHDLKGILHVHSTYSDGKHSLEEMANHCKDLGYQYLGITDHSKSAFYASPVGLLGLLASSGFAFEKKNGDFKTIMHFLLADTKKCRQRKC